MLHSKHRLLLVVFCWGLCATASAEDSSELPTPPARILEMKTTRHPVAALHLIHSKIHLNENQLEAEGIRVHLDYFLSRKIAFTGGYTNLVRRQGSALVSGFDFNLKWFAFSPGSSKSYREAGTKITSYSLISHHIIAGYASRTANFGTMQLGFSGPQIGYGGQWAIGKVLNFPALRQVVFGGEISREILASNEENRLSITNYSISTGLEF